MPTPNTETCGLPIVDCPHCGKSFHQDDYWNVEAGDEWECPKCEQVIHVIAVDHTIYATLATEKETP